MTNGSRAFCARTLALLAVAVIGCAAAASGKSALAFAGLCSPCTDGAARARATSASYSRHTSFGCRYAAYEAAASPLCGGVRAKLALRMAPAGDGGNDADLDARIENAVASRLVSGSAGQQNMPMTRAERRAYERLGEELMDAVRDKDAAAVKQLCTDKDADPAFGDDFGFSCLHLAAKRGYQEVVQALVDCGANINQEGEGATVPLHMAAQFGHRSLVEYMVGLGADVDLKDASGCTPLRLAQSYGRKDVEDYLRELVDTGSGRWAKADAEAAEQTIYDDDTFPWDDFLKENADKIVVDMEDEEEEEVEAIEAQDLERMQRGEGSGGVEWGDDGYDWGERGQFGGRGEGSDSVLDVLSKEVGAGGSSLDASEELQKEMDALLQGGGGWGGGLLGDVGVVDLGEVEQEGGTAVDFSAGIGGRGSAPPTVNPADERPRVGGPVLDDNEEEMILQSAVEMLLREIPGAKRADMSQSDQIRTALSKEAAQKRTIRNPVVSVRSREGAQASKRLSESENERE